MNYVSVSDIPRSKPPLAKTSEPKDHEKIHYIQSLRVGDRVPYNTCNLSYLSGDRLPEKEGVRQFDIVSKNNYKSMKHKSDVYYVHNGDHADQLTGRELNY
jgi:hypothetical protein